jgi:peptide/nickel transport system ATP-binding protein
MEKILQVEDLHVVYRTSEENVFAVNGLNLDLEAGESLGIVGETGAGKTTTAHAILQLLARTGFIRNGSIKFHGQELIGASKKVWSELRGKKIAMIFQDPMSSLNPTMTVGAQIEEVIREHDTQGLTNLQVDRKVRRFLKMVEIHPRRRKEFPHNFSGGMKQRIGIAMALACEPELIIADEPTTALDVTVQAQILRLIQNLKDRLGTSLIMITHDLGIIAKTCDRVAVMYAGQIVETGSKKALFSKTLFHHPYTTGLFEAIPNLKGKTRRLKPIPGIPADPTDLPDGCNFAPRCEHCMEICSETEPESKQFGELTMRCHCVEKQYRGGSL